MKKQIIALTAAVSIIFGSISAWALPTAGGSDNKVQNDPATERKYTVMTALGAMEDSISSFKSIVKRGDLITAAVRLSGYDTSLTATGDIKLPYSDIKADSDYYSNVATAYGMGYLPKDETTIRLEDNATVADAAKLLINVLGYGKIAAEGNITTSVMANRIGLTDGIVAALGSDLTNDDMIKMMYNALFTEVLEPQRFGSEVTYGKSDDLLSVAFDIEHSSGIVEANPVTSLYLQTGSAWDTVRIGDTEYKADRSDFDMIGHLVDYYYRDKDGIDEMVYMIDDEDNELLTVDTDDVEEFKERKIVYTDEKGRKQTETLDKKASFLYNGKLKKFSEIETDKLCGTVTLIDNDDDNTFEVVSVVSYKHILADGVNTIENTIADRDSGKTYDVEESENVRIAEFYKNGTKVSISDVAANDVVSVAETDSTAGGVAMIKAYICSDTVVGSVIYSDDEKVTVEDTTAEIEKGYVQPNLNDYGTFRFAFNGKIVFADMQNYVVYGFLYRVAKQGIDGAAAKIYTDQNRWVEVDLADRITYNGERKDALEVIDAAELKNEDGKFKPQLVSYRVNADGKLNFLKTAKTVVHWSDDEKTAIEDGEFRLSMQKSSGRFRTTLSSFDLEVTLSAGTCIFVVPGAFGDTDVDTENVRMGSIGEFVGDGTYANLYFYDVGFDGEATAMVIYGSLSSSDKAIYPVVGVGKGIDGNGAPTDVIMVKSGEFEMTLSLEDGVVSKAEPHAGDVVRCTTNSNGKVTNLEMVYRNTATDANKKTEPNLSASNAYQENLTGYGTVTYADIAKGRFILDYGTDGVKAIFDVSTVDKVYRYDSERGTVKTVDKTAITVNSKICLHARYGKVQEVVIFAD